MKASINDRSIIIIAFIFLLAVKIILLNQVLSSGTIGPQALGDEMRYKLNSDSIFNMTSYYDDHYPPFYPLVLSFAFFSKNNWYQWMFYINAVLSSLVLIPVWFISRRFLSKAASLLVLLISSLSTLHFFYPALIMSENLHVPVFAFSLYILLNTERGTRSGKFIICALLGITMALGYMTKYLYLVAVPALTLLWFVKPLFSNNPVERKIVASSRLPDFLVMCSAFIVTFLPWYIYKYYSDFGIGGGLGAEFVLKGIPEYADLKSLVLWAGFYLSYSILALAPFLLVFLLFAVMRSSHDGMSNREEQFFALSVILISAVFLATAIQHSWRAGYNYPIPKRINGRYLMQLAPLWVILFMIVLTKLKDAAARFPLSRLVYSSFLCLVLLFLPLVLLRSENAPWSYDFVDTTDGLFYRSHYLFILFGLVFIMMVITLFLYRRNRFISSHIFVIISILVIVIQAFSAITPCKYLLSHRTAYQLHGRALSPFIAQEVRENHDKIIVISDQPELIGKSGLRLRQSIMFWVSTSEHPLSIKFIPFKDFLSDEGVWEGKRFKILTELTGKPIYTYVVKGKTFYVYDIAVRPG